MTVLHNILLGVQILSSIVLIFIIAVQTTKSEQGSSGMGWGTIGGQASTSFNKFGIEAKLTRITTWAAVIFFVTSLLAAWVSTHI